MQLTKVGVYDCPICGKPRGSKTYSGQHDKCYKILQKQMAEKNAKLATKRKNKDAATRRAYLSGKSTAGVYE